MKALLIIALALVVLAATVLVTAVPLRSAVHHHHHNTQKELHIAHAAKLRNNNSYLRSDTFTISGISAGGAMATQYQFAWSTTMQAAGIIAGLPYYCSQGSEMDALTCMSSPEFISVATLVADAKFFEGAGEIDPLSNLARHYVQLWSGRSDTVVMQGSMMKLATQYEDLGVANMLTIFNYSSEHAWITNRYGNDCAYLGEPYVNNCGYDYAGVFLRNSWRYMKNELNIKDITFNETIGTYQSAHMHTFDQTKYGANGFNGMASEGYFYLPPQCGDIEVSSDEHGRRVIQLVGGSQRCHLHLNFHGCEQQIGLIGNQYVSKTNLNDWAETNNIVILYPQTQMTLMNPKACFEWWSFNTDFGNKFATKMGTQISMIKAMVDDIMMKGRI